MADNGLIIKISAESKAFTEEVDKIKKETADLEGQLSGIAKISGVAFAGLVASAGLAVHAYAEAEAASRELVLSLQNQGVASDKLVEKYTKLASKISEKTGIDDDAIVKGEAVLQGFLGQAEASEELVQAMVDLSAKTGSLESAAEILGRGINGNTKGLKQFGITIDETLTKEERTAEITEKLAQKFGGLAASQNKGLGSIKGLQTAFGNFLEAIGERLAPTITSVVQGLTNFFNTLNKNKPLLDFIFEVGKIALIVTGVITGVATLAVTIIKLQQAFAIAQAAVTSFGLASKVAVGATGIGLLLIVASEIYLNWNKIWPVLQAVFQTFSENVGKIAGSLVAVLAGLYSFNFSAAKAGLEQLRGIFVEGIENIKKAAPKEPVDAGIVQSPEKMALAKKQQQELVENERRKQEAITAEQELAVLNAEGASEALINIKKQEVETLKKIEDDKYASERESLRAHLEDIRSLEAEQEAIDEEQRATFQEQILAKDEEYQALSETQKLNFRLRNQQALQGELMTMQQAREKAAKDSAKQQIDSQNKYLEDRVKFGAAYATINQAINTNQVQGVKQAGSELVALQSSQNSVLKAIGKGAAITQITIDTARGAVAAYTGMINAIPFPPVSIPLGIAAAAGVIAYGAERISNVVSAAEGGVIPGFNQGGDSVPAVLQPGELVVPRANFSEVVNAVANQRVAQSPEATSGISTGGVGQTQVSVNLQFSGDKAEKFLTARQVEARNLGTLREASA